MALCLVLPGVALAGGPLSVAGVSGFNPGVAGTPVTWAGGEVRYYTDRGMLSSTLPEPDADALVAAAFARWTAMPTLAISAQHAGQLDEDVSGSNVGASGGVITMPADVQPSSSKPLGIIYDADGQVTDALLGAGAGNADLCSTNAAFGGADRFTPDARIAHALVVLNGNCAPRAADVPVLRYKLVRVLGRVLGLGWSQLNDNVISGIPFPRAEDYAGFPMMHPLEVNCGGPVTTCLPDAEQPRLDDRAAISRLYPVTPENAASFPGKVLFADNTARIHGSVRFGGGQPMQGVNVVARLIDSASRLPSRSMAASSVSGFLFRGNAGNPVSGYESSSGQRYDRFGSGDPALEGFFDLAGLELPAGASTAQYQLTVEALNPLYNGAMAVGPYESGQVKPSGTAQALVVTVAKGGDVAQDILMQGSAAQLFDSFEPSSFAWPAPVPAAGQWTASLSGYGDADFYSFTGLANRSVTIDITALDESDRPAAEKAQPLVGIWSADMPEGPPALAATSFFNTGRTGTTRLVAHLDAASVFKIGIGDYRGDGRPDFRYRAHVLYAHSVSPVRAHVRGGTALTITGLGFRPGIRATVGGVDAPLISLSAESVVVAAPASADGLRTLALLDPVTGATSEMANAITYGAAAGDRILLLSGANSATPVGAIAALPFRVKVVESDGTTAIPGATVTFSAPAAAALFTACAAETCAVVTDAAGEAESFVIPKQLGAVTIAASLADGARVNTTVAGTASATEISLIKPKVWIARGAGVSVPVTARVSANGLPLSGRTVTYHVERGAATLGATSVTTGADGQATATLNIPSIAADVEVSACVGASPCATFSAMAVAEAALRMQKIGGDRQVVSVGQALSPVSLRVTDASTPSNPVLGANVNFTATAFHWIQDDAPVKEGEMTVAHPVTPPVIAVTNTTVITDAAGLAGITPQAPASQAATIRVRAVVAGVAAEFRLDVLWPPATP